MKKRILSLLLCLVLVVGLLPTVAFATSGKCSGDCTHVAAIDTTHYKTLQAAIDVADGNTVTLLKDTTGQVTIPATKTITLDLNGHTLTTESNTTIINNGTLTVEDRKSGGKVKSIGHASVAVGSDSVTSLLSGTFEGQEGALITGTSTGATVTIEGGTYTAFDNAVIAGNGSAREGNANIITIEDGTFNGDIQTSGYIACGIYAPWKDVITVEGGTFNITNGIGVVARAGQTTITGGTFNCTGTAEGKVGDKKFNMTAAQALYFDNSDPAYPAHNSETDFIEVTGGTFSSDVSAYVADGFKLVNGEDGTYCVAPKDYVAQVLDSDNNVKAQYETLQDAFNSVATGDTVKLLTDVTLTEQVNIKKALNGLTFDGNNKTVTLATTTDPSQSGGSGFYFGNPNESLWCTGIKIKDLTIEGMARFGIFLSGGTVSEFTNVNISGDYLYAVNLYGTHGGTFTNCKISNSLNLGDSNEGGAAVWSNVAADFPVKLINSDLSIIGINRYTPANKLAPKIFVDEDSTVEVRTYDDGEFSENVRLCVSPESKGDYVIKVQDENSNWVEAPWAADVNGCKYTTFDKAVAAAGNGDTITLNETVTMDKTYFGAEAGETLTLDLNGHTLTRTWQDYAGEQTTTKSVIYNQGTLTIKDSSGTNAGKIQGYSDISGSNGWNQELKGIAISNASGATLNLEGGTITRGDVSSFGYYTVYNKGTFNMSGGLITNGSCASAMVCNVEDGSMFVMTGGELEQLGFQTLKNEPGSTVKISGGTLTSNDRTLQNYGTATISGGSFNGDIQVPSSGNLTIEGGTIDGEIYGREGTTGTISVSGGVFSHDPSDYLAVGYCMDASDNSNYPYTVKKGEKPASAPIIVKDSAIASVAEDVPAGHGVDTDAVKVDGVAEALSSTKDALVRLSGVNTTDAVKTEVEVNVNVTLTSFDDESGTLTFTATPVATITMTKQDNSGTITTETSNDVSVPNYMIRGDITVKLPLPIGFTPKQIKHTSENGYVEYFIHEDEGAKRGAKTFTIDENNCAVFTITHFSTFELSGEVTYVEPVYTGGGYVAPTYSIDTAKTENGSVAVSPKSASKGTTVTITATPDKGYELDTLIALDKDGKEIKLTEKNGKYTFEMPAGKVTVKASFKKIAVVNPFVDVKAGDYFYNAVLWAVDKNITSGTSATTFSPNEPCTRAQIVTFLWRAAGSPEAKNAAGFSDVSADAYYAKAVAWAVENGITVGTGDGKFSPDDVCTRAQSVTFLSRALKGKATAGSTFSDVAANSYYAEAVAWAVENDITVGTGNGKFSPDEVCTRGQIVTFLFRAMAE